MTQDPLATPVGRWMRPTLGALPEESLRRAAERLRANGGTLLPVVDYAQKYQGVVDERTLARGLGEAADLNAPIAPYVRKAPSIAPYATGAEALRLLDFEGADVLVVVDDAGNVLGLLGASDLIAWRAALPRPTQVGGMATPLGVYLTTGTVSAGAPKLGLFLTGMILFLILVLAQMVGIRAETWLLARTNGPWVAWVAAAIPPTLFLLAMRLMPLASIHAAEHQVVHAIERGEDLDVDVVRRMPRVHPRCGTNLAVGATLFLGIFGLEWVPYAEVRLLAAALATLILWRPLGGFVQYWITTKRARERHLAQGVATGRELLERYASASVARAGIGRRLWNSGLPMVISGSLTAYGLLVLLAKVFRLDLGIEL